VRQIQRAFRETLGLSPRDYAAACRRRSFYASLRAGRHVTDAIYESGYGSTSRVYGSIQLPGMTPATYGRGGAGAAISWLISPSPIGEILVASTAKGLCFVEVGSGADALRESLAREFPRAAIDARPTARLRPLAAAAIAIATAQPVPVGIPVDIAGTAFQWRVWRALTTIARGETRSYADIARAIGRPSSVRAVARACATNPLTLVVPCHRVVPQSGGAGGYRWGSEIKERLIDLERTDARHQRDR
jgi:AraC family transcriptional regulator of adaptative response/methylated-DNA-[protein]-cysteine methyltransferase